MSLSIAAAAGPLEIVFVRPDITRLQEQYLGRLRQHSAAKSRGSLWWGRWVRRPIRRAKAWFSGQPLVTTANWYSREWWLADCYRQWERYARALAARHPEGRILCVEPVSRIGEPPVFRLADTAGGRDAVAGEAQSGAARPGEHPARGWRVRRELSELVRDKLVLSALGEGRVTAECLRAHGARDVLMLERQGPARGEREALQVRKAYRRIPDVRKNNCNVALLHGAAAFALIEKREFARFEHVLVPAGWSWLAVVMGLLMYGRRGALVVAGQVGVPGPGGRTRRYLSYCYHLLFHDKVPPRPPGAPQLSPASFTKPHYFEELQRLAHEAGVAAPRTSDDMEHQLREAEVLPSLDMIGFYSNRNPFLKQRYFDHAPLKVGLATFFVRDFGKGLATVPELRTRLQQTFEILAEGAVDDRNRGAVLRGGAAAIGRTRTLPAGAPSRSTGLPAGTTRRACRRPARAASTRAWIMRTSG